MGKTITINQDSLITLKENMVGINNVSHNTVCVNEATPEVDEYELGQETDNPPVGGNYCHVNEVYNVSERGDLSNVDYIDYVPHDNAREEGYDESNITEFEPYYELMCYNNDGELIFSGELTLNELFDYFPERVIHMMSNREGRKVSQVEYRIEDMLSWDSTPNNIDDVEEVNAIAKRIQPGGPSAYLLIDGDTVSFPDHIQITSIDGMTPSKFVGLGNIRIGNGGIELSKKPTMEQIGVLKDIMRGEDKFYVDFVQDKGRMYPECLHSAVYKIVNPNRIINDIIYYFEDGIKPQGVMAYESKRRYKNLIENIDFEVNSSDIDLSSFKKKEDLAPRIWDGDGSLNPRVRLRLLDIADDFWEFVNLTWVKPSGIILTGSICNFNWSKYSDIDLHLIVDFDEIDEKTEFVRDYLDSKKNEWNNEHSELMILGFPVELYVQNLNEMPQSGGIYDLEENEWVKKPHSEDIKPIGLDKFSIKDKAAEIMTIIDDMYTALESTSDLHEIEEIGENASYLWKKVKKMRKTSLEKNGESGAGNIVYKILRRTGYLDKLFKLLSRVYDRSNSISESKEILNEFLDNNYGMPLYKYFKWADKASDKEKVEDILYKCPWVLERYLEDVSSYDEELEELYDSICGDRELLYDDEFMKKALDILDEKSLLNRILNDVYKYLNPSDLPAWMTMSFIRVVKNEWCIHFTSDAYGIEEKGFTGGTPEVEDLAYTSAGKQKPYAGYDFAFLIDDNSVDFNGYGNTAVIFRASGVLLLHYGDEERQVVFWGPSVKEFITIEKEQYSHDWDLIGANGAVLKSGKPSELAHWATENLPQYRNQIVAGKSGYKPWGYSRPQFDNEFMKQPLNTESMKKYLTVLKEEWVGDGNSEHNPYKKRWDAERKALKDFVANYGKLMQSKENGKLYKCYYDKVLSQLIGYNYCICIQWDSIEMKPKSVLYIRALDKFTPNIKQVNFDARGRDNMAGTYDDFQYRSQQQYQ